LPKIFLKQRVEPCMFQLLSDKANKWLRMSNSSVVHMYINAAFPHIIQHPRRESYAILVYRIVN
jgi:hypothetical protein